MDKVLETEPKFCEFKPHLGTNVDRKLGSLGTPLCLCLSEETLTVIGPFYIVLIPREVKGQTIGDKCVTCRGYVQLENDNFEINHSCVSPRHVRKQ